MKKHTKKKKIVSHGNAYGKWPKKVIERESESKSKHRKLTLIY